MFLQNLPDLGESGPTAGTAASSEFHPTREMTDDLDKTLKRVSRHELLAKKLDRTKRKEYALYDNFSTFRMKLNKSRMP